MNTTNMGISMWLFWIFVIIAVAIVIKFMMTSSNEPANTSTDSPQKILEKRYARGEIDSHEFQTMKEQLEKNKSDHPT